MERDGLDVVGWSGGKADGHIQWPAVRFAVLEPSKLWLCGALWEDESAAVGRVWACGVGFDIGRAEGFVGGPVLGLEYVNG